MAKLCQSFLTFTKYRRKKKKKRRNKVTLRKSLISVLNVISIRQTVFFNYLSIIVFKLIYRFEEKD